MSKSLESRHGTSVKRACDQCRRRKIRCDGKESVRGARCLNCVSIQCACTFRQISRRRKPRQGSGHIISELQLESALLMGDSTRSDAEKSRLPAPAQLVDPEMLEMSHRAPGAQQNGHGSPEVTAGPTPPSTDLLPLHEQVNMPSQRAKSPLPLPPPPTLLPSPPQQQQALFPPEWRAIFECSDLSTDGETNTSDYGDDCCHLLDVLYPTPMFSDHIDLQSLLVQCDSSADESCFNLCLGAYTLIRTATSGSTLLTSTGKYCAWADTLLHEAFDLLDRQYNPGPLTPVSNTSSTPSSTLLSCSQYSFRVVPKLVPVISCYVMFHCYLSLQKPSEAWIQLNNAATRAWAVGMHLETFYEDMKPEDREQSLCFYRLLFVTQAEQALQHNFIPTLRRNDSLLNPDLGTGLSTEVTASAPLKSSLCQLTRLYLALDEKFFAWSELQPIDSISLSRAHARIQSCSPVSLDYSNPLAVVVRYTQLWIEFKLWSIGFQASILATSSANGIFHLQFPFRIAQEMYRAIDVNSSSSTSSISASLPRSTLSSKIYYVACTCFDMLACAMPGQNAVDRPDMEVVRRLNSILNQLSNDGDARSFAKQLEKKYSI